MSLAARILRIFRPAKPQLGPAPITADDMAVAYPDWAALRSQREALARQHQRTSHIDAALKARVSDALRGAR